MVPVPWPNEAVKVGIVPGEIQLTFKEGIQA
jgi:hypothetical protein